MDATPNLMSQSPVTNESLGTETEAMNDEVKYIKEKFCDLLGKSVEWDTFVTAETIVEPTNTNDTTRYEISNDLSLEIVVGNAKNKLKEWIKNEMTTDNLSTMEASLSCALQFGNERQVEEFKLFCEKFQNLMEQFTGGIASRIESYMCFHGERDEKQLNKILSAEKEGAIDDLVFLEVDPGNAFDPFLKSIGPEAFEQLVSIYDLENQMIIANEEGMVKHLLDHILKYHKSSLSSYLSSKSSHCASNGESDTDEHNRSLVLRCDQALKVAVDSSDKINNVHYKLSDRLREILETEFKKQIESSKVKNLTSEGNENKLPPSQTSDMKIQDSVSEDDIVTHLYSSYRDMMQSRLLGFTKQDDIDKAHRLTTEETFQDVRYFQLGDKAKLTLFKLQKDYLNNILHPSTPDHTRIDQKCEAAGPLCSLPLVFWINSKFDVTTLMQNELSGNMFQSSTPGWISQEGNNFYFGTEAQSQSPYGISKVVKWDLFQLICTPYLEEKYRKMVVMAYFRYLKSEAQKSCSIIFNKTLVIFPDWLPENSQEFLVNTLFESGVFTGIQIRPETVAAAAAYFHWRNLHISSSPFPSELRNRPFVIILHNCGFIQVAIFALDHDVQPIKQIICENNISTISQNIAGWYSAAVNQQSESEATLYKRTQQLSQLCNQAFNNFAALCQQSGTQLWLQTQLDCILNTENADDYSRIETLINQQTQFVVNRHEAVADWRQLVIEGARLFSMEGTGKFKEILYGNSAMDQIPSITNPANESIVPVLKQIPPGTGTAQTQPLTPLSREQRATFTQDCDKFIQFIQLNDQRFKSTQVNQEYLQYMKMYATKAKFDACNNASMELVNQYESDIKRSWGDLRAFLEGSGSTSQNRSF